MEGKGIREGGGALKLIIFDWTFIRAHRIGGTCDSRCRNKVHVDVTPRGFPCYDCGLRSHSFSLRKRGCLRLPPGGGVNKLADVSFVDDGIPVELAARTKASLFSAYMDGKLVSADIS